MSIYDKYEPVIGLEVHAQLKTNSKAFCSDGTEFGLRPNTQIGIVSLGHPGTLPFLNKKVVELAVKIGLATNCTINKENTFARKNYFYPDLPKGYQISQFDYPICTAGNIDIDVDGSTKNIGITRIHLEEDAGKSIHDQDPYYSLIDLNRAGVALIEIVSEPDMRSAEEAYQYVTEIRKLVRYLDICDGNMEEGSLRCDANISVRLKGTEKFGQKVEVKNMNSIRNVSKAIQYEIKRQIEEIEAGNIIEEQTRSFNAADSTTFTLRSKEQAHDYRYFPEPDLPPLRLNDEYISSCKESMPELPRALQAKYVDQLGLSPYDAGILTGEREIAQYFEAILEHTDDAKAAANWLMGPVKSYINENAVHIDDFPVAALKIALIIKMINEKKISFSMASQQLFAELINQPNKEPLELATDLNLLQQSDESAIEAWIDEALAKHANKVEEYKNGKKGLIGLFMGDVMRASRGKADPKLANKLLMQKLNND